MEKITSQAHGVIIFHFSFSKTLINWYIKLIYKKLNPEMNVPKSVHSL